MIEFVVDQGCKIISMKTFLKYILSGFNLNPFRKKDAQKENKRRNGYWKEFNKHGILIREGSYNEGIRIGKWKLYYDTGEIVMEESYVNGAMEGSFKSFYKNGQMLSEGQYQNNKREGSFFIYGSDGKLIKVLKFEHDMLIEEVIQDQLHSQNV
jgi:antitoxin component YwqK of YwqJK toxin-antitoxin module